MKKLFSGMSANNLFAGLIVAVVALPLCIAFAIASGASPMAGIVSGVVGGFLAAAIGSSRFQVSGPAAAFITIIYGIIAQLGFPALLASTLIAGAVVIAIAALHLGKVMELMPHSIIVGFTTGIGVLILLGQLPVALGIAAKGKDVIEKLVFTWQHLGEAHLAELGVVVATVAVTLAYARTRATKWVPAPLVALAFGTLLAQGLIAGGFEVQTIGSLYEISLGALAISPDFLGALTEHTRPVLLAGLTLGVLIAVESLLSSKALDQMTSSTHNPDRELLGLGIANLAVPFLGGIPVSGVIVRGSTNVMSGGTEKTAAMFHAIFLAAFVALLFGAIKLLPMAALAAVLILTARRLIEVHEVRKIAAIDRWEGALVLLTIVLTVTVDLTVSVPLGVTAMLLLALRRMLEEKRIDVRHQHGEPVVAVDSNVNFLTAAGLRPEIERHLRDERVRTLDLTAVRFIDATGAMMLAELVRRQANLAVWVRDQAAFEKLQHAGVAAEAITLLGCKVVNLPAVFRGLQPTAAS
jgi:SulP family sulfate permease